MLEVIAPAALAMMVYAVYSMFRGGPPPALPGGNVSLDVESITLNPPSLDTSRETAAPAPKRWPDVLSFNEARQVVRQVIAQHFPSVDPRMVMAMIEIESSFRRGAERHEPHIRNQYTSAGDWSIGLMQLLYTTAKWLHDDLGYKAHRLNDPSPLYDPVTNIYFGCAYIAWLQNWRGQRRAEDWIVMSYNGGPGADNSMTRNHLAKYHAAKARQAGRW